VDFFNLPNPSSRNLALGSTQPLTEMSTRNTRIPGGKGRPARKADNLTAICEPIVYKMWEPQHLTTLWASTARYRDSFTLTLCIHFLRNSHGRRLIPASQAATALSLQYDQEKSDRLTRVYVCHCEKLKFSLCYEGVWGSGRIDPYFLDLETSWR
jgi:hypothetical protein